MAPMMCGFWKHVMAVSTINDDFAAQAMLLGTDDLEIVEKIFGWSDRYLLAWRLLNDGAICS